MSSSNPPKPTVDEDDIDDLDDVLDQFNPSASSSSQPESQPKTAAPAASASTSASASASSSAPANSAPAPAPAPAPASSSSAAPAPAGGEDDMNLPPGFEDLLSQQFAKELAQGMEEMFGGIKAPQGGAGAGADAAGAGAGAGGPPLGGDPNAQLSEEEMMKQFEKIMAEMGLGEGAGAGAGTARTEGAGASGSTSTTTPPAGAAAGSTGTGASTPNFQDAIRSTMSRLRQSEASSSGAGGSGANPFGDFSEADMAKLLEGLGGEGGMPEGEEGMAKMLESMMGELMSKEVLYEPLKELRDKYPPYLAAPTPNPDGSTPTEEDLTRYRKQYDCVRRVVDLFEDPKYDGGSDAEKKALKEQVGELMNEMQEAGAPPQEIVGDLPAELEGLPGFGAGGDGEGGVGPDGEQCVVM